MMNLKSNSICAQKRTYGFFFELMINNNHHEPNTSNLLFYFLKLSNKQSEKVHIIHIYIYIYIQI